MKDIESSDVDKNRSDPQPKTISKTILVTIHGTGAGDPTKDKNSWWQEESNFLEKLGQRLDLSPEHVEVVPFLWDQGPNEESSRREAGKRLYALLKSYDEVDRDYFLIGHSHGGSVAYSALLQSVAEKQSLKGLKCWCTVGTPFLEYVRNRFLFQRLSGWHLGLYVMSFTTTVFVLTDQLIILSEGINYLVLSWPLIHGIFLAFERYKGHARSLGELTWFTENQKKAAAKQYFDSWLGLCHPEDEAVSALSNIKDVHEDIIKPNFLLGLIPIVQLFLLVLVGIGFSFAPFQSLEDGYDLLLPIAIILAALFTLGYILKKLLLAIGIPLSWWANKVIWSAVRKSAWGDDVTKEDVIKIAAYPPKFAAKFSSGMPEVVADPLREHSSKSAIKTLLKVREILGMTINQKKTETKKGMLDMRSDLSKSLTWEELIHTSYFEVENFIDLVAIGLHRAGLTELKSDFVSTPERELLSAWYEGEQAP